MTGKGRVASEVWRGGASCLFKLRVGKNRKGDRERNLALPEKHKPNTEHSP